MKCFHQTSRRWTAVAAAVTARKAVVTAMPKMQSSRSQCNRTNYHDNRYNRSEPEQQPAHRRSSTFANPCRGTLLILTACSNGLYRHSVVLRYAQNAVSRCAPSRPSSLAFSPSSAIASTGCVLLYEPQSKQATLRKQQLSGASGMTRIRTWLLRLAYNLLLLFVRLMAPFAL